MTKTIEEAAKQAIIDNNFFMADPNHPEFVDRGLEQMRACKWAINHIFSLPLAQRLTAEEKERARKAYKAMSDYGKNKGVECASCANYAARVCMERIFGADFFKEGE